MNKDPAFALLVDQLQQAVEPTLVIADEQWGAQPVPTGRPALNFITNRSNVAASLRRDGARVDFNDFEFQHYSPGSFGKILFRIAKEKALVHHIINNAALLLPVGGTLTLIGHKNEGLDTYRKKAGAWLAGVSRRERGAGGYTTVHITRGEHLGQPLDDREYGIARLAVTTGRGDCYSKPGIYGWEKVDRGSELLVEALACQLEQQPQAASLSTLDLGCGYGYLSVMAAGLTRGRVVATDNNYAAVAVCEKNMALYGIEGQVIADDCGEHIEEQFDLILCNPPFHQGFATRRDITERFLETASRLLAVGGMALFVVNEFIDVKNRAADYFSGVEQLVGAEGFRVYRLTEPKQAFKGIG